VTADTLVPWLWQRCPQLQQLVLCGQQQHPLATQARAHTLLAAPLRRLLVCTRVRACVQQREQRSGVRVVGMAWRPAACYVRSSSLRSGVCGGHLCCVDAARWDLPD
jgi:hypothetical protein